MNNYNVVNEAEKIISDFLDNELNLLIEKARHHKMTPKELEEQRRSFAYGNVALHNPNVKKELINKIAGEMKKYDEI